MPSWLWIVIFLVALAVIGIAAWWFWSRRKRSERLRERFGPEYERTVEETGKRHRAEAELEAREERRAKLEIRPLSASARDRYEGAWAEVERRFVHDPGEAVGDADGLVTDVMRERGYPMDDFEQRAADLSVDHPDVVENYRAAHSLYLKHTRGEASTEDLRQATLHYRALVDELLAVDDTGRERRVGAVADSSEAGVSENRRVVSEEVRVRKIDDEGRE